jgi:hypothetical protein
MRLYDGQGSGTIRADFTGAVPRYDVRYTLSQFQIDGFLKPMSPKNALQGARSTSPQTSRCRARP